MLAFGLSIANQCADIEDILDYIEDGDFTDYIDDVEIDFNNNDVVDEFMSDINELYNGWYGANLFLPFAIAIKYYSIDQLIDAYKRKWRETMQGKMEQQTKAKDMFKMVSDQQDTKDIYERVKEVLGK